MALEEFKAQLSRRLTDARRRGVSDRVVREGLVNLGDVFINFDRPSTEEEALVREMWNVASEDEKKMLVGLVLKLADENALQA